MKKLILAAFILFLPFQLRLPQIPIINTINIFLILLLLIFIFGRNPRVLRSRFDTPLLIFLAIWAISFLHALFHPLGIWKYVLTIEFKRLITLVLAYFVFARCIKTKRDIRLLFYIFLLSVVLVALHTWRNGMLAGPHYALFKRSSGPFAIGWKGADIAGGFLAIFTPFVISFSLLIKGKIPKIIGFFGLLICFMGILTTYSRGSILALGVGSAFTILATTRILFKSSKIAVILIFAVFISLGFGWKYWVPESIIHRAEATIQNQDYATESQLDRSSQSRMYRWKSGLEIFKSSPIIGVGFKIPEYIDLYDTHNAFIQILAEMGVFGFLIFMWFLLRVFKESALTLNTEFAVIGAGFIGCITAFMVVNMFYSNFFRDTVVGSFWIILGMLTASKGYVTKIK